MSVFRTIALMTIVCLLAFACSENQEPILEESILEEISDTSSIVLGGDNFDRVIFMSELIENPQHFDGEIITVCGYVVFAKEERDAEEIVILSDIVFRGRFPVDNIGSNPFIEALTEEHGLIITGEVSDVRNVRLERNEIKNNVWVREPLFGELHTYKIKFSVVDSKRTGIFYSAIPTRTVYIDKREQVGGLPVEKVYFHEGCLLINEFRRDHVVPVTLKEARDAGFTPCVLFW